VINSRFKELTWRNQIGILYRLAWGLKSLHINEISHNDLHPGNILLDIDLGGVMYPVLTDFGLCKSIDESRTFENIYGVIPYMAPEILCSQGYTIVSDVYSFGMIMWLVLTGKEPYYDHEINEHLIIKILEGFRPQISKEIPELLVKLMTKCWDSEPSNRPDIFTIWKELWCCYNYLNKDENSEIKQQFESYDKWKRSSNQFEKRSSNQFEKRSEIYIHSRLLKFINPKFIKGMLKFLIMRLFLNFGKK